MSYYYYHPYYAQQSGLSPFKDRLDYLLAGRKLYPWAANLGISRGAAEKMQKGQTPGSEILKAISLQEGVELTWLVTGEGRAFRIYNASDSNDFSEQIMRMLASQRADTQNIYLCHDNQRIVIAVSTEKEYQYRSEIIQYQAWELYSGKFSQTLYDIIAKHFSLRDSEEREVNWYNAYVRPAELTSIIKGEMQPLILFGDQKRVSPLLTLVQVHDINKVLKPLLDNMTVSPTCSDSISSDLLYNVIDEVNFFCDRQAPSLNMKQRAKLYTAIYNHCQRASSDPQNSAASILPSLLDVI
ncbi:hypothetical protein [Endozoicomonas elysicola]|uniref:Uncharacterized protein n=1 Tax=Endozoicomonas elysicola TaxID=305900 RepID=A0A081K583_9GAMM|nr:hypothetical protein [Endozoicomonas elysicola]KEI69309.1 hypothetical protein GV64_24480 [Endozoicomonas elysicola]